MNKTATSAPIMQALSTLSPVALIIILFIGIFMINCCHKKQPKEESSDSFINGTGPKISSLNSFAAGCPSSDYSLYETP